LGEQSPRFVAGRSQGAAFRFKLPIHVVDTTVIELVANCMDWAQHRRRKAAAKTHMRLNLQSLLPNFVNGSVPGIVIFSHRHFTFLRRYQYNRWLSCVQVSIVH